MGFLKKLGGAALGTAGALAAGYGGYRLATRNSEEINYTIGAARGTYEESEDPLRATGAGLMEAYFQNQDNDTGYLDNLVFTGLGAVAWATATYGLMDDRDLEELGEEELEE